jgi:hypothetical protein
MKGGISHANLSVEPTYRVDHNYWAATDPSVRQMDQVNFKKNIALLGAAWMLLLIPQPWPLSLTW